MLRLFLFALYISELVDMMKNEGCQGVYVDEQNPNILMFMYAYIDNNVKNKKYGNFVSISSLTGKCAAQKLKNFCSSSLWTCLHHMVILLS